MLGQLVFLVLICGCWEEGPAQNNGRSQARLGQLCGGGVARAVTVPPLCRGWAELGGDGLCLLLPS